MSDEKKIIIDEDWKSKVQAEKEEAAKSKPSTTQEAAGIEDPYNVGDVPMPPASLEMLLTTLATEALVALGQVPHPATGKVGVHANQAKYLIDTIDVVRQKTNGNLTPGEQQTIDSLLHQLRMIFVGAASQPVETAEQSGQG